MKVCFVCLGNICRSPMAEFVMKSMVEDWEVSSRATSGWEHGNPVHLGTQKKLKEKNIPWDKQKVSQQMSLEDFDYFDKIYVMDDSNLKDLLEMSPRESHHKIKKIIDGNVPDPWYTGDFEETYQLLSKACENLMLENLT